MFGLTRFLPSTAAEEMLIAVPKEQVSVIKSYLGLTISDVASVLRVQRPTIYQWLSGSEPRQANLQRLNSLFEIALEWHDLCSHGLGQYLRTPILDGQSLLDLLSQDVLQREKISEVMQYITGRVESDVAKKSRRSISARLAKSGYQRPSDEEQLENLRGAGSLVLGNED